MASSNTPGQGQNVELAPLTKDSSSYGSQPVEPMSILAACGSISEEIDNMKRKLEALSSAQKHALNDPDSSATSLEAMSSQIIAEYRDLAKRIKNLKKDPMSSSSINSAQLSMIDRKLRKSMGGYQQMDVAFQNQLKTQMARQYRIVRPDASEAEVRQAVEDPSQQVFSQALLQSDRRGQSRSVLSAVQDRHAAIKKIEQQVQEIAELFLEMDRLVVQQEAAVVNIETKGEEVVENMDKGTQEIGTAIKSARNRRKWKWWCLGICSTFSGSPVFVNLDKLICPVLIIIIIVIIVLIYKFVIQNHNNNNNDNNKGNKRRSLLDPLNLPIESRRVISGQAWAPTQPEKRIVIPGLAWEGDDLVPERRRSMKFSA